MRWEQLDEQFLCAVDVPDELISFNKCPRCIKETPEVLCRSGGTYYRERRGEHQRPDCAVRVQV